MSRFDELGNQFVVGATGGTLLLATFEPWFGFWCVIGGGVSIGVLLTALHARATRKRSP